MQKGILAFEQVGAEVNCYRTTIKTNHGRRLFLEICKSYGRIKVRQCFYTDRNYEKEGSFEGLSEPQKLKTRCFADKETEILKVVARELDRNFYGVQFTLNPVTCALDTDGFIKRKQEDAPFQYHFLILEGSGEPTQNGLPLILRTRLKNRMHRSIYLELSYYKEGKGVIKACYYYDRQYKRKGLQVRPDGLFSCFFLYDRENILQFVNNELHCNFNRILIVSDGSIDVSKNTVPVCGCL